MNTQKARLPRPAMTPQEAFVADIIANPADDAPRLIYADYLQDLGQDDRAQLIRDQIAGHNHASPLTAWPDSLTRLTRWPNNQNQNPRDRNWSWSWKRGFIQEVSCPLAQWMHFGPTLCTHHPLQLVTLIDRQPEILPGSASWFIGDFPETLWRFLLPNFEVHSIWKHYNTPNLALEALSTACINWARQNQTP